MSFKYPRGQWVKWQTSELFYISGQYQSYYTWCYHSLWNVLIGVLRPRSHLINVADIYKTSFPGPHLGYVKYLIDSSPYTRVRVNIIVPSRQSLTYCLHIITSSMIAVTNANKTRLEHLELYLGFLEGIYVSYPYDDKHAVKHRPRSLLTLKYDILPRVYGRL